MPASQPASRRATHGMGKPSWEQEEPTKGSPECWELGAQAGASPGTGHTACTGLAWGTEQRPDKLRPRPAPGFHLDHSPAHYNGATAMKSKPAREGKCPSRPEPQPQNSLAWQRGYELLVATAPGPLLPEATRLQEWSGGPSGLQKQALSWP